MEAPSREVSSAMKRLLTIAVLATLMALPTSASARVLRVQKAPPLPPGSFGNIQLAINNSAPGDTISIGDGRYGEFFPYTWESDGASAQTILAVEWPLTFIGDTRDGVRIGPEELLSERDGENTLCMIQLRADNVPSHFENLTFENTDWLAYNEGSFTMENCRITTPGRGGLFLGAPDSVRFLRCLFEELAGNGVFVSYSSTLTAREVVFEDCTFRDSHRGFYLAAVQSTRVERCAFLDGLAGVQVVAGTQMTMEDCRFERMAAADLALQDGSVVTLQRCRFLGNLAHTTISNSGGHLIGSGNYLEGARHQTTEVLGGGASPCRTTRS